MRGNRILWTSIFFAVCVTISIVLLAVCLKPARASRGRTDLHKKTIIRDKLVPVAYAGDTRVLIVFAVADRAEDISNLKFFLRVGLQNSALKPKRIDTVISSDGPLKHHHLPSPLPDNVTHLVVPRAVCRDWSLYFAALRQHNWGAKHDVVVLMNGTVLGPLATKGGDWLAPFVQDLDAHTWLTGMSINTYSAGGEDVIKPNVQSMFLVTTPRCIQHLQTWGTWPSDTTGESKTCPNKRGIINNLEIGTSLALLRHGKNISCLFTGCPGIDYARTYKQSIQRVRAPSCNNEIWQSRKSEDPVHPSACGGFVKTNKVGMLPLYEKLKREALSTVDKKPTISSRPRVAVCFFGLMRNALNTTLPSIQSILEAIRSTGASVTTFLHTYPVKRLSYNRTGENSPLDPKEYKKLKADHVRLTSQDAFLETVNPDDYVARGDPYGFGWSAIRNNLCQLNSLREVTAMWKDRDFDAVMYLRPDLLYSTFDVSQLKQVLSDYVLLTPNWHKNGGANDRLAIGPPAAMRVYGNRIEDAKPYAHKKQLHAETFLGDVLKAHHVKHESKLSLRGKRVRANGKINKLDKSLF